MSRGNGQEYPALSRLSSTEGGKDVAPVHGVQFYSESAFLLDGLSGYIGPALGAGGAGIVVATAAHREGLAQRLTAQGVDIARAATQGRYVALDAGETLATFMRAGRPDAERFTNVVGDMVARATTATGRERPRVAIFGEMVSLLWEEGNSEAALQLELLWNDLAQKYTFSLCCGYPLRLFERAGDGEGMSRICAAHAHVSPAEDYASLITEEERLRAIALLQQKSLALDSAQRRMEQELRERNQQLEAAVASRDAFLSVAAHELKTPITGIHGFAQWLLRDARHRREIEPERFAVALDVLARQTGKLNQLVERLLAAAQIEAGTLRLTPANTDLMALVHRVIAQQFTGTTVSFVVDGPEHLTATVDPEWCRQAVFNVLDNAVKFSPAGSRVHIHLRRRDAGIELSITDRGVGIPPDKRERIFDRFQAAHAESHLSGLGLGLHVARHIIELHGGSIRIEQPEHNGSRFVVALPCAAGNAE